MDTGLTGKKRPLGAIFGGISGRSLAPLFAVLRLFQLLLRRRKEVEASVARCLRTPPAGA
jgi:hypothetical protein